jgi:hypothetical protein
LTHSAEVVIVRIVTAWRVCAKEKGEHMRLMLTVAVAITAAVLIPVAVAAKPDQVRVEPGTVLAVFPAGVACPASVAPDGVQWTYVGGNTTDRFFGADRFIETGMGAIEVTNIDTGDSVVLPLHGIVSQVLRDGGIDVRTGGTVLVALFPGDVGPGDDSTARTFQITGNNVARVEDDVITSFDFRGQIVDVCAMIA